MIFVFDLVKMMIDNIGLSLVKTLIVLLKQLSSADLLEEFTKIMCRQYNKFYYRYGICIKNKKNIRG